MRCNKFNMENCEATLDDILANYGLSKVDILNVDKYNLDEECVVHPQICEKVGEILARLESEKDSIEVDKDELFAKKAIFYKKQMEEKGEKTSDPKIEQLVLVDEEYISINKKYLEAKLKCRLMKNMREGLDIKSFSINNLVNLYESNYYTLNLGKSTKTTQENKLQYQRKLVRENN